MGDEASGPRVEAILVVGVTAGDLDAGVVAATDALVAAGVEVALVGALEPLSTVRRFASPTAGRLVVAGPDRALEVHPHGGPPTVVWRCGDEAFPDWWAADQRRHGVRGVASSTIDVREVGGAGLNDVLDGQRRARAEGALPTAVAEPGWAVEIAPDDHRRARAEASLLALSDGTVGVVGGLDGGAAAGLLLVSGAYGAGSDGMVRPLVGPVWTQLAGSAGSPRRWLLDLRTATLTGTPVAGGTSVVRFLSATHPGVGALRAERPAGAPWGAALQPPADAGGMAAELVYSESPTGHPDASVAATRSDRATITVVARERTRGHGGLARLDRIVAAGTGRRARRKRLERSLDAATRVGFDELWREHRRTWGERWRRADIEIEGDPDAQLAVRFALFNLLSCAASTGEAPVGARGLTGLAYAGHVFWDTEMFVLPALTAIAPRAARAVLAYRIARLPAAHRAARERGLPGARFPWESADSGDDVTPRSARDLEGRVVEILTGSLEEHINSDIAWAVLHHVAWTGDRTVLAGPGRQLVTETARYWAARIRRDSDGKAHIDDVIGPDEYHERVDDNAYTNGMVAWHLRQAARLAAADGRGGVASRWRALADALVDGYDPETCRHEQFAGYSRLEPLLVRDFAVPPVAADLLLGQERVRRSQVIKQPDVLMLHHVLPDEVPAASLDADLDHYLPRTAHGSSLSPAVCAAVLARAGRPEEAVELFDMAARIDLEDRTGTTAGGLHLATMGGLWQAVVTGFAGIRVVDGRLRVDPHLPERWRALRVHLFHRGTPYLIDVDHGGARITSGRSPSRAGPSAARGTRSGGRR